MTAPRTLTVLASALLLQACTLMPNYQRPAAPVSEQWPAAASTDSQRAAPLPWQEFLTDARLRELMTLALDDNRDLRIAALNVDKARAQYRIQQSELLPGIDISATSSNSRISAKSRNFGSTGTGYINRNQSVSVGITAWELDFFGRLRSLNARALAGYFATLENQRAAQMSLVSEVASAWLSLGADLELLALAQRTLDAQQTAHDLIARKAELGAASELELAQARTTVEIARADVAAFESQVQRDRNALTLLVGREVPAELLPSQLGLDAQLVRSLPAGLPSETLQQRPDVLAAEHRLRAANADIGAARAAFFPRLSLTSSVGSTSSDLDGLFTSGSRAWTFTPQLVLPIFQAGGLWASLNVSKVERDIAVAQYEKTLQTAFKEVADALADDSTLARQLDAQRALLKASQTRFTLSQARFDRGADSYLALLDAQRALYAAEQGLIRTRLNRELNLITLYKVVGGGADNDS